MAEVSEGEIINTPPKTDNRKVVYIQDDVFVHTSTSVASNYSANIIRGQMSIVEQDDSSFVNWIPASTEAMFDDYDINNDAEWSIVSHSKKDDEKEQPRTTKSKAQDILDKYTLSFETNHLHSIRRSDSKFHWHFLVFILKDGTTLPALHFHSGGTREFIQHLNRYIWLTKSSSNPKLFIACSEHDHALRKSLDHLQLFGSDSGDLLSVTQRAIGNAYFEGLGAFSKVTKMVRDAWNNAPEVHQKAKKPDAPPPSPTEHNYESLQSLENGFENLLPDIQPDLGPAPQLEVGKAVGMNEWMSFTNPDGKIHNVDELKRLIHRGGIEENLRKEIWKFLLGSCKYDQSYKERIQTRKEKWNEYLTMKQQWLSITPQQEKNFSLLRERKHLVDKDVIRTDRKHSFYKEGPSNTNTKKLNDILMTYCMYNFDLGYVQGMSDLLSPILYIMDDEADAFWCFVGFMNMVADNFEMKQAAIHKQLDNLKTLLQYVFPRLHHHFEKNDSGNLYFCFRWLLILFKREFVFQDVMRLWESLWTQDLSPNFHLFLCMAILKMEKDYIIENQCGFNEILKHINELSMNINLQEMLFEAEKLCLQLKDVRYLPDDVAEILTGKPVEKHERRHFPGKPVLVKDETDKAESSHIPQYSDDEIEILSEPTSITDKRSEASEQQKTQVNSQENHEMSASTVETQPGEELVVLSTNDKAVF